MTGCLPINSTSHRPSPRARPQRYLGIDVGAETIKLAEFIQDGASREWGRCEIVEHHKEPGPALLRLLRMWDWDTLAAAAVCGRLSRQIRLPRVPVQQVQARACRFLAGPEPATVVSIGSHGFSVLELRGQCRDRKQTEHQ